MDLTLRQLECLVAVADHGSISAAANALGVAQPTVTHQLQLLEDALGYRLLNRGARGVTVRPEGTLVLERSRRVLEEVGRLGEGLHDARTIRGEVRLGIVATASSHRFPTLYRSFRERYPQVAVTVQERPSLRLVEQVRQGDLDLAIVSLPIAYSDVELVPLWKEELVVIVPASNLELQEPLKIDDLATQPFISLTVGNGMHSRFLELFQGSGVQPQVVFQAVSMLTVVGFVAAGVGVAIAPSDAVNAAAQLGTIRMLHLSPPEFRQLALIHRNERSLGPPARALYQFLVGQTRRSWVR